MGAAECFKTVRHELLFGGDWRHGKDRRTPAVEFTHRTELRVVRMVAGLQAFLTSRSLAGRCSVRVQFANSGGNFSRRVHPALADDIAARRAVR